MPYDLRTPGQPHQRAPPQSGARHSWKSRCAVLGAVGAWTSAGRGDLPADALRSRLAAHTAPGSVLPAWLFLPDFAVERPVRDGRSPGRPSARPDTLRPADDGSA